MIDSVKSPGFNYVPKDLLSDTQHLSTRELGAYWRLVSHAWIGVDGCAPCYLPKDDSILAKLAGEAPATWRKMAPKIKRLFKAPAPEGMLAHKRLLAELAKQQAYRRQRSEGGKERAQRRWKKRDQEAHNLTRAKRLAAARRRGTHTAAEWNRLLELQAGHCVRCGEETDLVKDHIIPVSQPEATDAIANLQGLCKPCSSGKGVESIDHRLTFFDVPDWPALERLLFPHRQPENA